MANFDYTNSKARRNYYAMRSVSIMFFVIITIVNVVISAVGLLLIFSNVTSQHGLGQVLIAVALIFESYIIARKYAKIDTRNSTNLADRFSGSLIDFFDLLIYEARKENVSEISPEYVFQKSHLSFEGRIMLIRLMIPYDEISKNSPANFQPKISQNLVELISNIKEPEINFENLMHEIIHASPSIEEFLKEIGIALGEVDRLLELLSTILKEDKKLWEDDTYPAGVGQDWSAGYTPVLSQYSDDMTRYLSGPNIEINTFGHKNKIAELENILSKTGKNNVLLVGDPGVGKKTIVNALALKINQGKSLSSLKYNRIKQLDVGRLLAGASGEGELEGRINSTLNDAVSAGNIILYIDNFQSLLGGYDQGREEVGGIDATPYLIPYLQDSGLRVIASVTSDDYFNRVRSNSAILGSFEKVDVEPATKEDTLSILMESMFYLEQKYKVFFIVQSLKKIIELTDRFVHDVPFPEKSLRVMEEVATTYQSEKTSIITPDKIEELMSRKTNVPIGDAKTDEKEKLLNLEDFLHQRVIGQNEAIDAVANALRRARSGLTTDKRPVGSFLFLGPTGVGKTETAKALAENFFGSEKAMIRLDMSEYQSADSIDRLIGTVNNPNGVLTDSVIENPFSLILLDELEKADKNILNIFLSVFEDGRLTDPRGKVVDFTNAIIIATSNAGSEMIREAVQNNQTENLKDRLLENLQKTGIFTPEFLNRFDGVIVFKPLTIEELSQIAQLMIDKLNIQLSSKNVKVELDDLALRKLVELGYDPQFGARPMRRVVQEKIENILAKKMLEGEIQKGQTFKISINDIK